MGPMVRRVEKDEEIIDVKRRISLIRLIEGGAAMLVEIRMNHHNDRAGKIFNSPLVRKRLRDEVDS